MSPEEVRKVFGFDVDRSCLIVEVALYPPSPNEQKVSLGIKASCVSPNREEEGAKK